jgi:cytochrome c oxidase subunit III
MAAIAREKRGMERDPEVYHQYEDLDQQRETYLIGMWSFLVTEIMFFGALFICYMFYRMRYQPAFFEIHTQLDYKLGGANTVVLLVSSLLMALAVYFHQQRKKMPTLLMLTGVQGCAAMFMVIKLALEWKPKIEHHLAPWNYPFYYSGEVASPEIAKLFLSLYFTMTGLHGLHVVIGMGIIGYLMWLIWKDNPLVDDYIPTEMVGLYWHFVDIVWIFLYPLFYLLPR